MNLTRLARRAEASQSDAIAGLAVLAAMAEKQLAFPKVAFATVMVGWPPKTARS